MAPVLREQSVDDTAFVLRLQTLEDKNRTGNGFKTLSTASPIICVSAMSAGAC